MTPADVTAARHTLGHAWGLGRPLKRSELGRALGLSPSDPGRSVRDYETGLTPIGGSTALLLRVYLGGALPPDGLGSIRPG